MRTRLLPALIGFALGATLIGGVSVAATSSSGPLKACRTSTGVLTLASKHGSCADGQKKVSLDLTGPRGPRGVIGPQGPGAETSVAVPATAGTAVTGKLINVPGTSLIASASCTSNQALFTVVGKQAYTVTGQSSLTATGGAGGGFTYMPANGSMESIGLAAGSNLLVAANGYTGTGAQSQLYFVPDTSGSGGVAVDLLYTVGTTSFTVNAYLSWNGTTNQCTAIAQVTPTS